MLRRRRSAQDFRRGRRHPGPDLRHQSGNDPLHHRTQRCRQDHAVQSHHRPLHPDPGPHPLQRRGYYRTSRRTCWPATACPAPFRTFRSSSTCRPWITSWWGIICAATDGSLPSLFRFPSVVRKDVEYRERAAALMSFVGLEDYIGADTSAMPYGALKRLEIARAPGGSTENAVAGRTRRRAQSVRNAGYRRPYPEGGRPGSYRGSWWSTTCGWCGRYPIIFWCSTTDAKLAEGTGPEVRANPDVVAAYLGEGGRDR